MKRLRAYLNQPKSCKTGLASPAWSSMSLALQVHFNRKLLRWALYFEEATIACINGKIVAAVKYLYV